MYNTLFGMNNLVGACLTAINLQIEDIPRFRDAIFFERNKHHYVEILTRTGGCNRGCYNTKKMLENENYMKDYDDKYDETYRHFIYRVPKEIEEKVEWNRIFEDQTRPDLNIKKMFKKEIKEMNIEGTPANERATKIVRGIEKLFAEHENDEKVNIITVEDLIKAGGEDGRKE